MGRTTLARDLPPMDLDISKYILGNSGLSLPSIAFILNPLGYCQIGRRLDENYIS